MIPAQTYIPVPVETIEEEPTLEHENPYAGFTRSQLLGILLDWAADPPCPDLFIQAWRMTFDSDEVVL